jgi:hypothetical protein
MISPLGQRQIFQTVAVETVKMAMDGGFLVQQEQARRQAFDAKLVEALLDVPGVVETDFLKLTKHDAEGQSGNNPNGTGSSDELPADEVEGAQAEGARPHLDLLA